MIDSSDAAWVDDGPVAARERFTRNGPLGRMQVAKLPPDETGQAAPPNAGFVRNGLLQHLQLAMLDQNGTGQAATPDADIVRKLALIRQDLGAFGARRADGFERACAVDPSSVDWQALRHAAGRHFVDNICGRRRPRWLLDSATPRSNARRIFRAPPRADEMD